MTKTIELTQSEYARHRGVTPKAILKAIAVGRIPPAAIRREGRAVLIDAAAADLALGASQSRTNTPAELADSVPAAAASEAGQSSAPGLTKARTAQAEYDARLKELEYLQRVGKLVPIEAVTRSMELCAEAMIRDLSHLRGHAEDLVTAASRGAVPAVRALLVQIERDLRSTIAQNMRLLGAGQEELEEDAEASAQSEARFRNDADPRVELSA